MNLIITATTIDRNTKSAKFQSNEIVPCSCIKGMSTLCMSNNIIACCQVKGVEIIRSCIREPDSITWIVTDGKYLNVFNLGIIKLMSDRITIIKSCTKNKLICCTTITISIISRSDLSCAVSIEGIIET